MVHQNTTNWVWWGSIFSLQSDDPTQPLHLQMHRKVNLESSKGSPWKMTRWWFHVSDIATNMIHRCTCILYICIYIYVQYTYFMRLLISTRWTYRSSLLTNSYPTNWMMIPIDYSDYNWLFLLICIVLFCKVDFPHVAQGNNHTKPCDYAVKPI